MTELMSLMSRLVDPAGNILVPGVDDMMQAAGVEERCAFFFFWLFSISFLGGFFWFGMEGVWIWGGGPRFGPGARARPSANASIFLDARIYALLTFLPSVLWGATRLNFYSSPFPSPSPAPSLPFERLFGKAFFILFFYFSHV
jgi:hypothetical protein